MLPAWQYYAQYGVVHAPHDNIHHRFSAILRRWQTIVETTEQLFAGILSLTLDNEGRRRIVDHLPNAIVIIVLDDINQTATQSLPCLLQWQAPSADSLQMSMVWCRCSTMGTII